MKTFTAVLIMIGSLLALGTEYFVNKQGNDASYLRGRRRSLCGSAR
jgi:hypothetical protein